MRTPQVSLLAREATVRSIGANAIAITPDGSRAYVPTGSPLGPGLVSVIDTATNTRLSPEIAVGDCPAGVATTRPGAGAAR